LNAPAEKLAQRGTKDGECSCHPRSPIDQHCKNERKFKLLTLTFPFSWSLQFPFLNWLPRFENVFFSFQKIQYITFELILDIFQKNVSFILDTFQKNVSFWKLVLRNLIFPRETAGACVKKSGTNLGNLERKTGDPYNLWGTSLEATI
jgi:hypothetical protein